RPDIIEGSVDACPPSSVAPGIAVILYRLRTRFERARFDHRARAILASPPLARDPSSRVVFVTQLCHDDLLMYLLAVKSLARFLAPARVCVLDDTSLTAGDRDVLARHVPGVELSSITSVKNTACPAG